jgi:hypothetical protein
MKCHVAVQRFMEVHVTKVTNYKQTAEEILSSDLLAIKICVMIYVFMLRPDGL